MNNGSKIKQLFILLLLLSFAILPRFPLIQAEDLSGTTIEASPTTIYSLQNTTISVTVQNTSNDKIVGANVGVSAEAGEFPDGTPIHNGSSDSNGEMTVQWKAPVVNSDTYYNFTAIIKMPNSTTVVRDTQVLVLALDYSDSTINANPPTVNELESTEVTVTATGAGGPLEGATVHLDSPAGTFSSSNDSSSQGLSDAFGEYADNWTAPEVPNQMEFLIVATISYIDYIGDPLELELNVTVNPVEGQLYLELDISPGQELTVGDTATIEVTLKENITNTVVNDADVSFSAIQGNFSESDSDFYVGTTDAQGKVTVHWETDGLAPAIVGTIYSITIIAGKIGLQTNETTIDFLVQPALGELSITIESSKDELNVGESVTIDINVEIDGLPEEGAYVEIIAQAGTFNNSGSDQISGFTDASGSFTAVWETADIVMGSNPVNYTFTITIAVFPYPDEVESLQITLIPISTSTNGGLTGDSILTSWWFYLLLGGAIIIIGAVIIVFRSKK
ncbi:MAG: hypothetical protein GF308_07630 [Candidatus Heimdallarchaeota archaeon]|nr:hypothetical protein [Candidatus Heimdallarchaeota archaeon]